MGLDGGGAGGGGILGVGGVFTGPAQALELVGRHCYAYSGTVPVANVTVTMLEFTTGNYYVKASYQPQYLVKSSDDYEYTLLLNDAVISKVHTLASDAYTPLQPTKFIIPAYTKITLTAVNTTDTSENNMGVIITGRLYRR